jgi:hypothetical protein
LRYQIKVGKGEDSSAKNVLLEWVRSKIPEYNIQGFTKDWNDGKAICALVNAIQPGLCPEHRNLDPKKNVENATRGIDMAYENFDVPKILDPSDMCNPRVDELSMMTYISYLRDYDQKPKQPRGFDASRCKAYGPGLVEGVQGDNADFTVEVPSDVKGKLEIRVEGPKNNAKVELTKKPDGNYACTYVPDMPGEWKVHVTVDGHHVPGSTFHVTILEAISLGGEGKIRVYYSTTNKSDKSRADVSNLQKLLERKEIHKRPDFEPWIPVDVMDKPDREAVFKKAGTRALPIVFIDDKYTGDHDTCVVLEKSGALDQLLKYKPTVRR